MNWGTYALFTAILFTGTFFFLINLRIYHFYRNEKQDPINALKPRWITEDEDTRIEKILNSRG